jgi:hypothetical protein
MAGAVETEVDLAPGHLLRWLEAELGRPGSPALSLRATRDWRIEPAGGAGVAGLDEEDELAAHVAYGTLELAPPDGAWRLTLEVIDPINGGAADDWPPVGIESDGPDEVPLARFAETFPVDDLETRLTLHAQDGAARRRAERLIARILADAHGRR